MIKTTKEISKNENILIYGKAGVGKTSLVKTLDCKDSEVLIIDADRGTKVLQDYDFPVIQISSLTDAFNSIRYIKANTTQYKWVVVDAISELSSIFLTELKEKNSDTRQAYMKMGDYILDFIKQIRELPINKYFISHESRVEDQDDGSVQYCPALEGSAVKARLPQFFDIILALRGFKNDEGEIVRKLQSGGDLKYVTKDRTGKLDDFEEPDLKLLFEKIKPVEKKATPKIVKEVAEVFGEPETLDEVFSPDDVPEGNVRMELDGKEYQGKVEAGLFTFKHKGKQFSRELANMSKEAQFFIDFK